MFCRYGGLMPADTKKNDAMIRSEELQEVLDAFSMSDINIMHSTFMLTILDWF